MRRCPPPIQQRAVEGGVFLRRAPPDVNPLFRPEVRYEFGRRKRKRCPSRRQQHHRGLSQQNRAHQSTSLRLPQLSELQIARQGTMWSISLVSGYAPVVGVEPRAPLSGRGECKCLKRFGGPGRVRTVDLFHAMEARSQLRHRPTRQGLVPI